MHASKQMSMQAIVKLVVDLTLDQPHSPGYFVPQRMVFIVFIEITVITVLLLPSLEAYYYEQDSI